MGLKNKEQSETRVKEFDKATDYLEVNNKILLHIPEHKISEHYNDFLKFDFSKYKNAFIRGEHYNNQTTIRPKFSTF